MEQGFRQNARLFLEGREVPFISASIVSEPGKPCYAQIDMVPLQVIKFIRPRTHVVLVVRDDLNFGDDNYYLAFEGFVFGRSYGKSQTDRNFSIIAFDYSAEWEECPVYVTSPNYTVGMVNSTVTSGEPGIPTELKATNSQKIDTVATSNNPIINIILSEEDIINGIVKVVNQLSNANLFYQCEFERFRVNDRLVAFSSQKIKDFLKSLDIQEFLENYSGIQGGQTSLSQILCNVMNLVFHDFLSIPFPSIVPFLNGNSGKTTIGNFMFIPDGYCLPPPKCNIVFPNRQISYSFNEDFRSMPTRYGFRFSFPVMQDDKGQISYPTQPIQFYPTGFSDFMSSQRTITEDELNSLLGPSTLFKAKDGRKYSDINYGDDAKSKAVDTSTNLKLRVSDYLSNEESIRGIYYSQDTFPPAYTSLVLKADVKSRQEFTLEIGRYLFYKKRYAARPTSAQLLFCPFLVPGFNMVLLDDSDAGQTVIAKLLKVTHVLTNSGCATQVELGYGRDFDEIDALTGKNSEPPLPTWFDNDIFGSTDNDDLVKMETAYLKYLGAISSSDANARYSIKGVNTFPNLGKDFYQKILGVGSMIDVLTTKKKSAKQKVPPTLATTRGAAEYLIWKYRNVANNSVARERYVSKIIKRPIPTMAQAFNFIGAVPVNSTASSSVIPDEFAQFVGSVSADLPKRYDGIGYQDEKVIAERRGVIDKYIKLLRSGRGFRG